MQRGAGLLQVTLSPGPALGASRGEAGAKGSFQGLFGSFEGVLESGNDIVLLNSRPPRHLSAGGQNCF